MQTVLLIDDDVELVEMLKEYIEQENFTVLAAHDGVAGAQMLTQQAADIVVLDVMMPKLNGIETLKVIRQQSNVPVIMLTAKGDNTDRIIGLELGADDYVPKPSSPREIVARIRAILRRVKPQQTPYTQGEKISIGALSIWPAERRVVWADAPVVLTSTEYSLLEILAKNAGQVGFKTRIIATSPWQAIGEI